jgi:hypothetical protein
VLFVVVVIVGLVLRLLALRTSLAQQNSDTAVVYLMARHVAQGDLRIFYWGQFYGGTLLQLTAGALFWLIGPSFAALQVVEILFWLAAALLLRSIVAAGVGATAGDLAGSLFWLATPLMIGLSFTDPGFVGDGLAVGLGAIYIAQAAQRCVGARRCLGVGFCLGLALWTSPLSLGLAVPAAVWTALRVRTARAGAVGLAAVALGALPWLYESVKSGFKTLEQLPGSPESPIDRYFHVYTQVIPAAGGLGESSAARAIGVAALVAILLGAVVALRGRNPALAMLAAAALLVPAIAAASRVAIDPTAARYATYLLPTLAAVIAWALSRMPLAGVAAVFLVSGWTIGTVWNSTNGLAAVPDPAIGRPIATLAARLERMGRTEVWADYWIAYMLSAATQERIVAGDLSPRREESYLITAAQAPKTTVVLYPNRENEHALRGVDGLPPHTRILIGPFAVWTFDTRTDVDRYLQASY